MLTGIDTRAFFATQSAPPHLILDGLPELLALFIPTLRADFGVLESHVYRDEPPLPAAMTVYGGREDPIVTAGALGQWRQHTTGPFALQQYSGGHFYLQTQRSGLLASISARLLT